MKNIDKKKCIGLLLGLLVAVVIWNLDFAMPIDGRKCLALSLMAVIWWATKAVDTGITSIALLLGYVLFLNPEIAPASAIFNLWSTPTIYLVIGGFLISDAIKRSGLGERIAYYFIKAFVKSYTSVIVSCYVLGFLLSFMIPHPWPRSFLLLSVMSHVIKASKLSEKYARHVGVAIFIGSIPTSMILITGDSTLNSSVASFSGEALSWTQWFLYMGIPGIMASVATCFVQLKILGKPGSFTMERQTIDNNMKQLGKMKYQEKASIIIMLIAVALWMTDSLHGIASGWVALGAAVLLALPVTGVITKESWGAVNLGTLLFLCAALSIGSIGKLTGMNEWIAASLMPSSMSSNPYIFALAACGICMIIHMVLGSTLAVLGIAAPAIVTFGAAVGIPPLVSAMIAYTAVCLHWILPFHHMNILVGVADNGGGYTEKEVSLLGAVQTMIVVGICMFEVLWWSVIGLL